MAVHSVNLPPSLSLSLLFIFFKQIIQISYSPFRWLHPPSSPPVFTNLCTGGEKYHPCFLQGAYSLHYKSSPHTPHNALSPDPLKICDSSHIYIFSNFLEVVRLFFAHFRTWRGNLSIVITCVLSNGQITLLSPFFFNFNTKGIQPRWNCQIHFVASRARKTVFQHNILFCVVSISSSTFRITSEQLNRI